MQRSFEIIIGIDLFSPSDFTLINLILIALSIIYNVQKGVVLD